MMYQGGCQGGFGSNGGLVAPAPSAMAPYANVDEQGIWTLKSKVASELADKFKKLDARIFKELEYSAEKSKLGLVFFPEKNMPPALLKTFGSAVEWMNVQRKAGRVIMVPVEMVGGPKYSAALHVDTYSVAAVPKQDKEAQAEAGLVGLAIFPDSKLATYLLYGGVGAAALGLLWLVARR
jgi:hypothetical protein